MVISLTGFMGCGKSTIGKILASRLNMPFVDLDDEIIRREGRSIADIFATAGEKGFRQKELQHLREVLDEHDDMVLSLGGGAVTTPECAELVHDRTTCVWLQASPETVQKRTSKRLGNRPLLDGADLDRIREMMARRDAAYRGVAHIQADTDVLGVYDVAEMVDLYLRSCPPRADEEI